MWMMEDISPRGRTFGRRCNLVGVGADNETR